MAKMYKGFNKDMTCTPAEGVKFQYEEGKTYETENAALCNKGFHCCEMPLDCFSYYPPARSVYHEVELDDVSEKRDTDSKRVGKKITIGARLDIAGLIKAQIRIVKKIAHSTTSGDYANSATSGDYAHSATSGNRAHSATSGNYAHSATSGYGANSATSGYGAHSATSGNRAHSATSGDYAHSATSGDYANSATSGDGANSATSGYGANSATSGYGAHSATSGNRAHSATSGNYAHSEANGLHSIAAALGEGSHVKAALGNWIVAAEYDENGPICVKSALVDGEKIKPDTWYKVENGEFVEVDE